MRKAQTIRIPELCKNSSLLVAVVCAELLAILIVLLDYQNGFLVELGLTSLYCQWSVLVSLSLLCLCRKVIHRLSWHVSVLLYLMCCLLPFIFIELVAQWVLSGSSYFTVDWSRFLSYGLVVLIVCLALLRVFALTAIIEQRSRSEAEMRVQALQARIKPHFLFNSLNTISELIHRDSVQAEKAVEDLSFLFRTSLETDSKFHSLDNEINLCHRYIELERWRLDKKLQVEWHIQVENKNIWQIPKLLLQPIVENAIVHGRQLDGSVQLKVDVRETKKHLSVLIENLKGNQLPEMILKNGHGIALDNIKERLFVLYDDLSSLRVRDHDDRYQVIVRLPKGDLLSSSLGNS